MLQLDSAFNERAYGASSFSDFIEKLKRGELVNVSGTGGRYIIERKGSTQSERPTLKPEDLLPPLRDVLENHRLEIENGCPVEDLAAWFKEEQSTFDISAYGFQAFNEFLNYAQDKTVVRMEPHEEQGMMLVSLGAGFAVSAIAAAIASVACLALVRPALVKRLHTGPELSLGHGKLVGQQGKVTERITGLEAGRIKIGGEIWSALPYDESLTIEPGSTVEVLQIRGATAYVHPVASIES